MFKDVPIAADEKVEFEIVVRMFAFGITAHTAFAAPVAASKEQAIDTIGGQGGQHCLIYQLA
jgi:hypothetical protein